jgi:hypothetical protein
LKKNEHETRFFLKIKVFYFILFLKMIVSPAGGGDAGTRSTMGVDGKLLSSIGFGGESSTGRREGGQGWYNPTPLHPVDMLN